MDDEKDPKQASSTEEENAGDDADLLGGLESLLDEESTGLDLGDDDLSEDDLTDLFDDDEDGSEPESTKDARQTKDRGRPRSARQDRRLRDQEGYQSLEAHLRATPLGLEISDDKMTATVSRITADNSLEEILGLIKREARKNRQRHRPRCDPHGSLQSGHRPESI